MALNKAAIALVIMAMVLVASTVPTAAHKEDCFCPCMRDQCMVIDGSNREECAEACTKGCHEAHKEGQPNEHEFCGF